MYIYSFNVFLFTKDFNCFRANHQPLNKDSKVFFGGSTMVLTIWLLVFADVKGASCYVQADRPRFVYIFTTCSLANYSSMWEEND